MARCRDLRQLKITGVDDYDDLRRIVKSNSRAIDFYVANGQAEEMPKQSVRFAAKQKEKFQNLMA